VKKTVQNNPFLFEEISVVRHKSEQNAIFHKTAGWVNTERLLNLEINKSQIEIKQIQSKSTGHRLIDVNGKIIANHDVVILCNPQSINNLLGQKITCEHYSGSILQGDYQPSEKVNLSQDGYIIFDDKTFACGSSYHKNKDIQDIDQNEEEKSLEKKIDWFDDKSKIQNAKKQIWTGNRFTTKQRIPYVGKVLKEVKQSHNRMEFIWRDNILINSFYGSKGFTLAPLASRIIVKMLNGNLDELDAKFLNYLNPYQNLIKGHNKKNIIGFNYA
jgi:glycine/D-amino acid oxidase-like deaminating enzyme